MNNLMFNDKNCFGHNPLKTIIQPFFQKKLNKCKNDYIKKYQNTNITPNKPIYLGAINNYTDENRPSSSDELAIQKLIKNKIKEKLKNLNIEFNIFYVYGLIVYEEGIIYEGLFEIRRM